MGLALQVAVTYLDEENKKPRLESRYVHIQAIKSFAASMIPRKMESDDFPQPLCLLCLVLL